MNEKGLGSRWVGRDMVSEVGNDKDANATLGHT